MDLGIGRWKFQILPLRTYILTQVCLYGANHHHMVFKWHYNIPSNRGLSCFIDVNLSLWQGFLQLSSFSLLAVQHWLLDDHLRNRMYVWNKWLVIPTQDFLIALQRMYTNSLVSSPMYVWSDEPILVTNTLSMSCENVQYVWQDLSILYTCDQYNWSLLQI